jgi:hypothetical protein
MKHIPRIALASMICVGLLAAPAEAVDWTASTSLSLKASDTHVKQGTKVTFTIKLKSKRKPCYQHQPVRWYKNGNYKKTVHTNNKGVVKLHKKMNHTGTFRAKYLGFKRHVHPNRHVCHGSQSRAVKVTVKRKH